jgi:hypothetical protein
MATPVLPGFPLRVLTDLQAYRDHFGIPNSHRTTIEERVWATLTELPNGCLVTSLKPQSNGYIQIDVGSTHGGHKVLIHRLMWALVYGEWPPVDRVVMHGCDTRNCCAPQCLTLGTHQENVDDMIRKGRHRAGSGRPLAADLVEQIRGLREEGMAIHRIAKAVGVARETVAKYVR